MHSEADVGSSVLPAGVVQAALMLRRLRLVNQYGGIFHGARARDARTHTLARTH